MRDMTYIERDAFGRGNFAIDSTANGGEEPIPSPRSTIFFNRVPHFFRTMVGLFSRNRNMGREGDEKTNGSENSSTENNGDSTHYRNSNEHVDDPNHDAQSDRDQHISRDVFGRGDTAFLENAMIRDNNSTPAPQSLMIQRGRLDRSATNSTVGQSESLSHALSPIFSDSSVQSEENKYLGDQSTAIKCHANNKTTVGSQGDKELLVADSTTSGGTRQDMVPKNQTKNRSVDDGQRTGTLQIETEEEYQFDRDPEVDYTGQGSELEREMSLGSSCDDEFLTAH